jgi:hypothetical protein
MEETEFALGADEMGMSFILVGQREVAKRYLASMLGKIDPGEVKGRLLAAYDTLMARKLANWSGEERKVVLDGRLEPLIEAIATPRYSVITTTINGAGTRLSTFHFGSRGIVEVRDRRPIGQDLYPLDGPEAARASVETSMSYPESLEGKRYAVKMSLADIDKAQGMSTRDPGAIEGFLAGIGLDEESAEVLASDIVHKDFRGVIVRLDYDGDVAHADHGMLTLRSAERAWIFKLYPDGETPMVDGKVATREEFSGALKEYFN